MNSDQPIVAPWQLEHSRKATPEDVFYCFRLILGRVPHREEWPGHAGYAVDADLDDLVRSYIGSLEFSRRSRELLQDTGHTGVSLKKLRDYSIYVQDGDSAVGRHIRDGDCDTYEPHVSRVFRDRIQPGMHVVDIGANIGYFSMLAASLVGPSGSVTAVEPNPFNVKLLELSRRANGYDHVRVIQSAAGREIGLLVLNSSHSNGTTSPLVGDVASVLSSTTVPSFPIDSLVAADTPVGFVKIDVEGAEFNAMTGASGMIARSHPVIASEFSPDQMRGISGVSGEEYLQYLIDFGYRISIIELDGSLSPCGQEIAKVMNAYRASGVDHIDILFE